jgi:alkanesulfonate monooxygenase SsuD/methylene tetrahydromethanopterin reductase-like flavin-dependent oxidoreductase (luciferase family)
VSLAPKFALILSSRGVAFGLTTPRELLDMSQTADESGLFDSVWVGDSLLAKPRLEAIVLLAGLAARTRRVKLATACLSSFPLRNAIQLAQQWASLDLLAGGRTILVACMGGGVAGGEFAREYRTFGVDPKERAGRLEEGIELIRRLWSEERVTYRGRYYDVEDLSLAPKPAAPPPIWIANNPGASGASATTAEKAFRRVARLADGWMTAFVSPEQFGLNLATIRRFMREEGRALDRLPTALYFNVNVSENRESAFEESRRYFEAYYGAPPARELLEGCLAWGPPDECAEKIVRFFSAEVETVGLRLTSWNQTGQLRRVLSEVIPACLARS